MSAPYKARRAPAFAAARALALAMTLALLLSACSLAPRYERPGQDIPEQWRKVDLGSTPLNTDWWTRFNDPVLTAMVEEALKNNQDLAESLAKIDSAAAQVGIATSQLLPSVSGDAAATSQSSSTKIANYSTLADRSNTNYQGSLNASWELDFWGKYRNNYTALSDVLMNTVVGHEALRLSVAGQTAQGYFALLALDMQLDTARRTLKSREDAFGIYTSRYKQGDITELDWQRARAEVETARAQVHTSTVSVDQAEAALAVLLGRSPRDIINRAMPRGQAIGMLPSPPVLPEGLPVRTAGAAAGRARRRIHDHGLQCQYRRGPRPVLPVHLPDGHAGHAQRGGGQSVHRSGRSLELRGHWNAAHLGLRPQLV